MRANSSDPPNRGLPNYHKELGCPDSTYDDRSMVRRLSTPALLLATACSTATSVDQAFPTELRQQVLAERSLEAPWDQALLAEDLQHRAAMAEMGAFGGRGSTIVVAPQGDGIL